MQLTNKKYINNSKRLNRYVIGKESEGDALQIFSAPYLNDANQDVITYEDLQKFKNNTEHLRTFEQHKNKTEFDLAGVIPFIGSAYNSFTDYKSAQDIINDANVYNRNVAGIGFQTKEVDNDAINSERKTRTGNNILEGAATGGSIGLHFGPIPAAIGTIAGGIIGGVGSIVSNNKEKRRQEQANISLYNQNQASKNNALSKYIQLNNAKKYGNQSTQYLYGAKDGKQPVVTPYGIEYGKPNAKVSNGEIVGTLDDFGNVESAIRVPGKKNNKDTKLAKLYDGTGSTDKTFVISNKHGLSDWAALTGDYETALNMQREIKEAKQKPNRNTMYKAKCGKLPKHGEGLLPNLIPSALGSVASIGQYLQSRNSEAYRPNSYISNPYETQALSVLGGLNINPYPIMNQLKSAEMRTNRAIDMSGGLSSSQRSLSRLSSLNNTQRNIANSLAEIQAQNNNYFSNYSNALLSTGAANAQRMMQANQFDLDYYSKSHAARQKGMQTGIYNLLNNIQSYYANDFKRRQFNNMMSLYVADQKQKQEALAMQNKYYTYLLNNMPKKSI